MLLAGIYVINLQAEFFQLNARRFTVSLTEFMLKTK
jgi:hypothetical protein